jgi:hypothetical protein
MNPIIRSTVGTVAQCAPNTSSADAVVLTLDIDWAIDEVLADCIDLVEGACVPATWFVTHDTPLLERLRNNKNFELGIHPNFNPLLEGKGSCAEYVIDSILEIVPEAVSIRSHSLTQSSRLLDLFRSKGLRYDCNYFIPEQAGIVLKPWRLHNGMIRVPHFWEDDIACIHQNGAPVNELIWRHGLKVFDFHPIHIFLNSADLSQYERTKNSNVKPSELLNYRFQGIGTRSHLLALLSEIKKMRV